MSNERFLRSEMIFGKDAMDKLKASNVAVIGLGGVGGAASEALVRGGIGSIFLMDHDKVSPTDINRQIISFSDNAGRYKTEVMKERALRISPEIHVETLNGYYGEQTPDLSVFDYIVDAIDSMASKILLITEAKRAGTQIISCMGAGNKLDPCSFEVADIYETSVCPVARIIRRELKKREINGLKVVYSREKPIKPFGTGNFSPPGSVSFVPPVAGYILAGEVIKDLAGIR